MTTLTRQTAATLGAALITLIAGQPAVATTWNATPAENGTLKPLLVGYMAAHNAGTIGGILAIGPFGTPSEVAAIIADTAAKTTAPVFSLPAKTGEYFEQFPNAQMSVPPGEDIPIGAANCVFKFGEDYQPTLNDGNDRGIEAQYASIFGYNYDPLENVFSDFGMPGLWHPQADVTLKVNNRYLAGSSVELQLRPEFPEGRHFIEWRAETKINPITDIALPVALTATFSASEGYLARKLALLGPSKEAAKRSSRNIHRLINLASELKLVEGDVKNEGEALEWYRQTSLVGAVNSDTQEFVVWDVHTPYFIDSSNLPMTPFSRGNIIEEQVIEVEALDFGGVKFDRVYNLLRAGFEPADDCGRQFKVGADTKRSTLLAIGAQNVVEWYADEVNGGPYHSVQPLAANQTMTNEQIRTVLTQRISVVDTQVPILLPPAGFARYDEDGIDLTASDFPLGRPRVVDLADPSPAVTNDAPEFLPGPPDGEDGVRYTINWDATDASDNAASSTGDPARLAQTITLKRPGTNTVPEALPASAQAVTARPVDIWLNGIDSDLIDGRVDPLEFKIDSPPGNGQFDAPDYPYFIEDFRLTPVGEREEGDNLTRVSPLLHLADRFRLALHRPTAPPDGSDVRGTVLNQEICVNPTPESQAAFGGVIPTNFVYKPTYVYVDDNDFYYIRDNFFHCDAGGGFDPIWSAMDRSGELSVIPRISKWNAEGDLLDVKLLLPAPIPGVDTADAVDCLARDVVGGNDGYYGKPGSSFTVDHTGRMWMGFQSTQLGVGFSYIYTHCSIAAELGDFTYHGTSSADGVTIQTDNVTGPIVGDAIAGVLYQATPENGVIVRRSDRVTKLWSADPADMIGILALDELVTWAFTDIKVDGDGNVMVLEKSTNRVHKYLPTTRTAPDAWQLGEYVGWMGSCTTNKTDPVSGIPYNRCDEQAGTSRGFACTDTTCNRAVTTAGPAAGQFDTPASIEIDPNNVLYVADTENSRVQRFSAEGTFAGEARSTGTGVNQGDEPGFILGNMGKPRQLSVNSNSFFVMEPNPGDGDEFVHAYKTMPFRDVTDSSAMVRYISDFNYQGNDSFTYTVNDGIDESAPAAVNIAVSRDFNPPEKLAWQCFAPGDLQTQVECRLDEDGALYVRLSAEDRDGFISDFPNGLDAHDFSFVELPGSGSIELDDPALKVDNATTFLYTPDADFNGTDSFVFTATDAYSASTEQHEVTLTVDPVPDPVVIDAKDSIMAARGLIRVVSANYRDTDKDSANEPGAVRLQWGDGVVAQGGSWENSGNYDSNEREISPQIELAVNEGMLVASHRYDSVGTYSMQFEMANPAGTGSLANSTATTTVDVIDATVVGAGLAAPQAAVGPVLPFPIEIDVINLEPEGWAGLSATNVRTSIDVPDGVLIASVDARCSGTDPIDCDLGDLAPGETATIVLGASIPLENAREQQGYLFDVETVDDGPSIEDRNLQVVAVNIADSDVDGVIDYDDAYPDDPDYNADSDGDGLADRWELNHGLDPFTADDPLADTDGDGFSLIDEFTNGSFPNLNERETTLAGQSLGINDARDDRFGIVVAGGDLNQDGYADVVIGAPQASATGNVYIQYGSEGGAVAGFEEIRPVGSISQYGRAIAVGDWDDNGYPDLAIANGEGFYVHYNNGEILDLHDDSRPAFVTGPIGNALLSADLDGDGKDDLIASFGGITSGVYAWTSSLGGFDTDVHKTLSEGEAMGNSLAVGDIDGDGAPDLLVGSLGGPANDVFVYLGRDNDWANNGPTQRSFTLLAPPGQSQFGFKVVSGFDVGGDGIDDVVVGDYAAGSRGAIHLYDSASDWIPAFGEAVAVPPSQTILGLDDGAAPGDARGDQFGVALALGHLNADDYADLVVGGNRAGVADQGQVRIFRGGPGGFQADEQVEDGMPDFDMLGYSVAIPGDIDGDGFNDVVAGAPDIIANGRPGPDGGYVQAFYHAFVAANPNDDPDNDGVATAVDNCPSTPNTNQSDIDGDDVGDACDADMDGDGTDNEFDSCPLNGTGDHTDFDSDGQGNVCDDDDDNDGTADVNDPFPLDPRYTADTDSDGMPDEFETGNGLDPQDPGDAQGDLDGDGRSNLEEFEQGTNINADDVAPSLVVPGDIRIDSVGPLTAIDLGAPLASDFKDGDLTAIADDSGPFVPGRHVVTWRVSDAAGNESTDTQQVDVVPMIGFDGSVIEVPEGDAVQVALVLNGNAVDYPVTVPVLVAGTAGAGSDYTSVVSEVVIASGTIGLLDVATLTDAINDDGETIELTLGEATGAAVSASNLFILRISEGNIRPAVELNVLQGTSSATTVTQDGGPVDIFAIASDPNQPTTLSFDWTGTSPALFTGGVPATDQFVLDPAGITPGVYRVEVAVLDDGVPRLSATAYRYIEVIPSAVPLGDGDTDGDGIDDDDEGAGDANGNGVDDYLDPSDRNHLLIARTGGSAYLQVLEGQQLRLGPVALASGSDAELSMSDVEMYGNEGSAAPGSDDVRFRYPGGLFDFAISALNGPGSTALVVIPQNAPVPDAATYRKFTVADGWSDFVIDGDNNVMSAPGDPGVCPAPGSASYVDGLATGHHCVQLLIEDGGANDADGLVNGFISDPGGVAMEAVAIAAGASLESTTNKTVAAGARDVVILRFAIDVNSPDVEVASLTLNAGGTGNDSVAVTNVVVRVDVNSDGLVDAGDTIVGNGSYQTNDGVATITLTAPYMLPMGETDFLVSYDF